MRFGCLCVPCGNGGGIHSVSDTRDNTSNDELRLCAVAGESGNLNCDTDTHDDTRNVHHLATTEHITLPQCKDGTCQATNLVCRQSACTPVNEVFAQNLIGVELTDCDVESYKSLRACQSSEQQTSTFECAPTLHCCGVFVIRIGRVDIWERLKELRCGDDSTHHALILEERSG